MLNIFTHSHLCLLLWLLGEFRRKQGRLPLEARGWQNKAKDREQVMTLSGKSLMWLKNWSPALVDRILLSIKSISYQE